jgi:hypothetical protein
VTGAAIEALRESVSELAKSEPDSNRLVTLLRRATDAAGHIPGAAEQVKRIIANAARSEPPPGTPGDPGRPDG